MLLLNLLTITCVGLMIGTEFAVSVFINPIIWQLDDVPQAQALSLFARTLGRVMPFWYGFCLVLLTLEAWFHRQDSGLIPVSTPLRCGSS